MYELTIKENFAAAHFLRRYPGKCAQVHGHTWEVETTVAGRALDELGMLVDFGILKAVLRSILNEFDHRMLNDLPAFNEEGLNPTAENLAKFIFDRFKQELCQKISDSVKVGSVRVWESATACARYQED